MVGSVLIHQHAGARHHVHLVAREQGPTYLGLLRDHRCEVSLARHARLHLPRGWTAGRPYRGHWSPGSTSIRFSDRVLARTWKRSQYHRNTGFCSQLVPGQRSSNDEHRGGYGIQAKSWAGASSRYDQWIFQLELAGLRSKIRGRLIETVLWHEAKMNETD